MTTPRQRALRKQQEAERALKRFEAPFAKKIYRATSAFYKRALFDQQNNVGEFSALYTIYKRSIYNIIGTYALYSIKKFTDLEFDWLIKTTARTLEMKRSKKQAYVESIFQDYMHKFGAQQVRYISETSRKDITDALTNLDLTQADIQDSIQSILSASISRAAMIARTETHNAGQFATIEVGKNLQVETGITFVKSWVASQDERTRPTHAAMDPNNFIGIHELFDVGDSQADRPGDPQLPPEELINCRCVLQIEQQEYVNGSTDFSQIDDSDLGDLSGF